jgi:hypothetical protein
LGRRKDYPKNNLVCILRCSQDTPLPIKTDNGNSPLVSNAGQLPLLTFSPIANSFLVYKTPPVPSLQRKTRTGVQTLRQEYTTRSAKVQQVLDSISVWTAL